LTQIGSCHERPRREERENADAIWHDREVQQQVLARPVRTSPQKLNNNKSDQFDPPVRFTARQQQAEVGHSQHPRTHTRGLTPADSRPRLANWQL